MEKIVICPTCNTNHVGKFCHECGMKNLTKNDTSLWGFYLDVFYNSLSICSKFFDGVKDLCFPGRVTNSYLSGDRREHIRPLQLFGVVNLLFYIVLYNVSVFFTRIDDMAVGHNSWPSSNNYFHYDISGAIQHQSERYVLTTDEVDKDIESSAGSYSKSLLILLVPTWGFLIYFAIRKHSKVYLRAHVLAVNCLSFYMLLGMVYIFGMFYFKDGYISDLWLLPFHILFAIYVWFSISHVFKTSFWSTTINTGLSLLGFFLLLSVYRQFILILTIAIYKKTPYINLFESPIPQTIIGLLIIKSLFDWYVRRQKNGK